MTTEEALEFLQHHQPMPSDWDITDEEGEAFAAILVWFQQHPDPRCVPLLVNSVSLDTGLGMYEHIGFVLMAHDKDAVVPHLRRGLMEGSDGVKHRCCWWASDVDAWDLADVIEPLAHHPDEDVSDAAQTFMELRASLSKRTPS